MSKKQKKKNYTIVYRLKWTVWEYLVAIAAVNNCRLKLKERGLDLCMAHLEGLPKRDPIAVEAVMNGMVLLSGIAMSLAGVSQSTSGMEHWWRC